MPNPAKSPVIAPQPILPGALYTAESLMAATGLGSWALREMQRNGLRYRVRANRRWFRGEDFIRFIDSDDSCEPARSSSNRVKMAIEKSAHEDHVGRANRPGSGTT